jgi:hypothetical protein
MNDFPNKNLGLLEGQRPSDYTAGTLPYEVVLESGDWRPFCPPGESQADSLADTMACVSFSNSHVAEISLKQQGYDFDLSERALAKMSNTTPQGNYLYIVEDTARGKGRLLQIDWPVPDNFDWNSFYADIPQDILKRAILFTESYEWIPTDLASLQYHLKQAPIQITIPAPHPNHAVVLVHIEGNIATYFDTYKDANGSYFKTMDCSLISSALKIIIKNKSMTNAYIVKNGSEYAGALPLTAEAALTSFLLNVGVEPPKKPDGSLDFDKLPSVIKVVTL